MLGMALGIICGCIPEAAIIICTGTPVSRACKACTFASYASETEAAWALAGCHIAALNAPRSHI